MRLFVISALVIAFLAILFALQNTNLVTIQFFLWQYQQSLALVLLATLAIGIIVGLLVSFPAIIRRNFKAARLKKQTDTLTEMVQEKEQEIGAVAQKTDVVKQNYGDLLKSLDLIEPITGLLRYPLLSQMLVSQLQAEQGQADSVARSLSVLLFKVQPQAATVNHTTDALAAVARLLKQHASVHSWCYSDGEGLFATLTSDMDMRATTRYGETLQATLLEQLPPLATGEAMAVDISVGGAIAPTPKGVDAQTIVSTAKTALDQALQRGRNRLRLLQAA